MAVEYLGSNGPDGTSFGTGTSEKISFHGVDPVAQQTVTLVATDATAGDLATTLRALQEALETLGLIAD